MDETASAQRAPEKYLRLVPLAAAVVLLFGAATASAAQILVSPAGGTYYTGRSFTIGVYVSSPEQAMNAIAGVLTFPTDKLEVVSLSKTGSILNLWVQEPTFSNQNGTVNFEGVVLNPGYQGSFGKILTVTFRARLAGTANVGFASGSILANDGQGTNILDSMPGGTYILSQSDQAPIVETTGRVPVAPTITVSPPLTAEGWTGSPELQFNWNLPDGVDAANYAVFNSPSYTLPATGRGLVSSARYDLDELNEGTWHFYVRLHNAAGWGPSSRKQFKIDRTPPEDFSVTRLDAGDPTNPTPEFTWETEDSASGLAGYDVKIGDGDWVDAENISSGRARYTLPTQGPGWHTLAVRAKDNAGNFREKTSEFEIEPLSTPIIEQYTERLQSRYEVFEAAGTAMPGVTVRLALAKSGGSIPLEAKADENGRWQIRHEEELPTGTWDLTVTAEDKRGAKSYPSTPVKVRVSAWWGSLLRFFGEWGLVIVGSLLLLALLIALFYFLFYRLLRWRSRMKRELIKFKEELRADLKILEKDLAAGLTKSQEVDLRASALTKRKEDLGREISHLEKDIKEEIKKIDKL